MVESVQKARTIKVGVDSCAAVSVMQSGTFTDYPLEDTKTGTSYKAANGQKIVDEGRRSLVGTINGSSAVKGARFRVAKTSRCLMSVSEMVDQGKRVVFDADENGRDISYVMDKTTGEVLSISRNKRVYEFDFTVLPFAQAKSAFGRQGR